MISIVAIVTSLSALFVSYRQLKIASEEQQTSVFPYLTMAYNNSEKHVEAYIKNDGLGPAFISGVEVEVQGKIYKSFWEPVASFLDTLKTPAAPYFSKSDLLTGWVVRPDAQTYLLFKLENLTDDSRPKFWKMYSGMKAKVWYFDIYNNCWLFDSEKIRVERCAKCPNEVLAR